MLMWSIFRLLISLFGIFFIFYVIFISNRNKKTTQNIRFNVRHGERCYGCKCEIDTEYTNDLVNRMLQLGLSNSDVENSLKNDLNMRLCISCIREERLNTLSKNILKLAFAKFKKINLKIDKCLYHNNSKAHYIYLGLWMLFIILDVFFIDITRFFFYAYNFILYTYWYITYRTYNLDHIKIE